MMAEEQDMEDGFPQSLMSHTVQKKTKQKTKHILRPLENDISRIFNCWLHAFQKYTWLFPNNI